MKALSYRNIALLLALLGAFLLVSCNTNHIMEPPKENNLEAVTWDVFLEKSSQGKPCITTLKADTVSNDDVTIEYNGEKYIATRSDGTSGSGRFLLSLTGQLPMASTETSFIIISDNKYSFDEILNEQIGTSEEQLDYFLVR